MKLYLDSAEAQQWVLPAGCPPVQGVTTNPTLLRRAGHTVLEAVDGIEALELWRTQNPNLVLMDMQMPRCDGLACTRALRAEEAQRGRPRTPVVALTSNAFEEDRRECLAAGMDAHLSKPIRPAELFAMLQRFGVPQPEATLHAPSV